MSADEPTADPHTVIEGRGPGYVRYRRDDGRRWEVWGECQRLGHCLVGATVQTPDGPVEVRSLAHIEELKAALGRERIDSALDVPVAPGFNDAGCCQFVFVDLGTREP